jgi:uncharacterized protein (UPF0179 family)
MGLVTLIGEQLAEKNTEFIFLEPHSDCSNCKLKTVCFNLKPYHRYKIIDVRDKRHNCTVHEGSAVVIEVEELPTITTVDKKIPPGSITQLEPRLCNQYSCEFFDQCTSKAIQKGKKYKINVIVQNVECLTQHSLHLAEVIEVT